MSRYFLCRTGWLTCVATSMLSMGGIATRGWVQEASPGVLQTAESLGVIQSFSTKAQDLASPELEWNISSRAADLTPPSSPTFSISSTSPTSFNESVIRDYILGLQLPPAGAIGRPIARVQIYLTNPPENKQTEQTGPAGAFEQKPTVSFETLAG